MNRIQYDLVKTFLDVFRIDGRQLAREWHIDFSEVLRVSTSPNYARYLEGGKLFDNLFGSNTPPLG